MENRFSRASTSETSLSFGALFETAHPQSSFMGSHSHDFPYVSIVLQGTYTELRNGLPEERPVGALVFHPANEEHADYFGYHGRCLNIALPGIQLRETAQRLDRATFEVAVRLYRLMRAVNRETLRSNQLLEHAAQEFVGRLLFVTAPREMRRPAWMDPALKKFEWASEAPLTGAASYAGVHYTHFSREFRRCCGLTPNEYRRRERVRRASNLLLCSSAPLRAVALECGFGDQSHFTNAFRALAGMTPAKYRFVFGA